MEKIQHKEISNLIWISLLFNIQHTSDNCFSYDSHYSHRNDK